MVLQYPLLHLGKEGPLSRREAVANMVVNMLGVGVLAMPKAIAEAGLLASSLVLFGLAVASRETLLLLLSLGARAGHRWPSYPEIGKCALGPQGLVAVFLVYLLYSGGLLTAFMVALTDLLQQTVIDFQGTPDVPRFPALAAAMVLCVPGMVTKSLHFAAVLSGACQAGAALLVLSLLAACWGDVLPAWLPGAAEDAPGVAEDVAFLPHGLGGLLKAGSLFAAQLTLQAGFVEVLGMGRGRALELDSPLGSGQGRFASFASAGSGAHDPCTVDMEATSRNAYVAAALLLSSVGSAGYMRFGGSVAGDVLASFGTGYSVVSGVRRVVLLVARGVYSFTLVTSAAFVAAPCRAVVLELFAARRSVGGASNRASRRASVFVLLSCGFVAWLQRDLAEVLSFVGAWAAGPLSLVFPSLFAVELARRQEGRPIVHPRNAWHVSRLLVGALLVLGHLVESVAFALSQPPGHRGQRITVMDLSNITSLST